MKFNFAEIKKCTSFYAPTDYGHQRTGLVFTINADPNVLKDSFLNQVK